MSRLGFETGTFLAEAVNGLPIDLEDVIHSENFIDYHIVKSGMISESTQQIK